jgi:hypothetical protein
VARANSRIFPRSIGNSNRATSDFPSGEAIRVYVSNNGRKRANIRYVPAPGRQHRPVTVFPAPSASCRRRWAARLP